MIHCLAGAHRAGTAAVAWLMYAEKLSVSEAIILAKSIREEIDPIGSFPELLQGLENGFLKNDFRLMRVGLDATKDLCEIYEM